MIFAKLSPSWQVQFELGLSLALIVKLQPKPKAKRLGVDFVLPPSQQLQQQ